MVEVWKSINEFYDVSNMGRVRSWHNNKWGRLKKPKIRKIGPNGCGYFCLVISYKKKRVTEKVHRLVMKAFVGPSDLLVNHKNGIKTDNRLENLEYCTSQENAKHAVKIGLTKTGEQCHTAKLTEKQVIEIFKSQKSQREISEEYKIHQVTVSKIKLKKIWKHLHQRKLAPIEKGL